MLGEVTFRYGDIEATIATTLLANFRYRAFMNRLVVFEDATTDTYREVFILIAAHTAAVTAGMDWQPPAMTATSEDLMASFETFYGQLPTAAPLDAWVACIRRALEPLADADEKGTGAPSDFLAPPDSASSSATPTRQRQSSATRSRTRG